MMDADATDVDSDPADAFSRIEDHVLIELAALSERGRDAFLVDLMRLAGRLVARRAQETSESLRNIVAATPRPADDATAESGA